MKKLQIRKTKEVSNYIIPECLNCGKPLASDDIFCSYCGQKNIEKLNFSSFVGQLVSGFFSYDSRLWTTIVPLILKPGIVSKNYIDGKRKRYVNPFQMYLHVSILFFLILGWTNRSNIQNSIQISNDNNIVLDSLLSKTQNELADNVEIDSLNKKIITDLGNDLKFSEIFIDSTYNIESKRDVISEITFSNKIQDFNSFNYQNPNITNTKQALDSLGYPNTFWNTFYFEQVSKIRTKSKKIKSDKGESFFKSLISNMSIGLFLFLPLFALSLKLFYYRKHMNYMEHLVFVFHTQTVFFLLLIISTLIGLLSSYETLGAFTLLFLIYLYLALRKFYNQGHFKTFVKFILLNITYSSLAILALMIISVIAFMID